MSTWKDRYLYLSPSQRDDEIELSINALIKNGSFTIYVDSTDNHLLSDGLCQISLNVVNYEDTMKILNALKNCFISIYAETLSKENDIRNILDEPKDFVLKDEKRLLLPHLDINVKVDKDLELIHSAGVIDESRIINEK